MQSTDEADAPAAVSETVPETAAGPEGGPAAWRPNLANDGRPVYLAVADAIAEDVGNGRLPAGRRLPPQRVLADLLGVDLTTVSRAYNEARRRGLIGARVGQGTFVRGRNGAENNGNAVRPPPPAPAPLPPQTVIDMTMNQPPLPDDPALLTRLRDGLTAAAAAIDAPTLLRYPDAGGGGPDKQAAIRWLGKRLPGFPTDGDRNRAVVAPGTQSVLTALLTLLARPGDAVCTEALTYPGFRAVARQLGLRVIGAATDGDGPDPDALRAVFAAHAPRAFYCTPTLHNPTTVTWSAERRAAVAAVAREFGVPIIEDDIYGVLPQDAPPPAAVWAPESTWCVAGLAKCVAPGLRLAYVAAPDARQAARLETALRATAQGVSPIAAAVAARWINDGSADLLLAAIRAEATARTAMARALLTPVSGESGFAAHPEGFHLWLTPPPPWTRGELTACLHARSIVAAAGDAFAVAGPAPEAVRICLGAPIARAGCRRMLETLADVLEQGPALAGAVI